MDRVFRVSKPYFSIIRYASSIFPASSLSSIACLLLSSNLLEKSLADLGKETSAIFSYFSLPISLL